MHWKTILCAVDFSPGTRRGVRLAGDLCRRFGARLVLFHDLDGALPGLAKRWEWQKTTAEGDGPRSAEDAARVQLTALAGQLPAGVEVEVRLTRGPVGMVLERVAEDIGADLVVLATHGRSTDEHTSLAERLVDRGCFPVLVFGETAVHTDHALGVDLLEADPSTDDLRGRLVVATDFSPASRRAWDLACDLARQLPLELDLLHVVTQGAEDARVRRRLQESIPDDLRGRVRYTVISGEPAERIEEMARAQDATWLVLGEHGRGLWHRLFARDTARDVLHRAPCPVLYVPAA